MGQGATFVNVYAVSLCILIKTRRTSRFRVARERALCIHTVKANSTIMASLHTLIDIFTNVIVDLVSGGTGDQSLTDVTPSSVHAALIQLAGTRRQTLIYVFTGASVSPQRESW